MLDIRLDHRRIDPHRPRPKPLLPTRLHNHRARDLRHRLHTNPAGELANRRLVRHPLAQTDPAEPAQMNRVRHLRDQRPIPPPVARLEQHHPNVGLHRDRRPPIRQHGPPILDHLATKTLHDRPQQLVIGQQRIQRGQILGQLLHLDRQRLVPQALRLLRQKRQHELPFQRETPLLAGHSHCHTGRKSPLADP